MRWEQPVESKSARHDLGWEPAHGLDVGAEVIPRLETLPGIKTFSTCLSLSSARRTEVSDITRLVREAVRQSPVSSGFVLVNTLHTTCALFINEFQDALICDLKALIERLVPEESRYRHNDPRVSDCERGNAHAHLRAALLGRSIALGVIDSEITLGQFQSVIFAEFDGPRKRTIRIQALGE